MVGGGGRAQQWDMPSSPVTSQTQVAIVGAGPAALMLSHLLSRAGIDSVAIDLRSRQEIEETHRAGILEQDSVDLLVQTGVSDRVLRDGYRHDGIELAFGGAGAPHRLPGLVGAATQLYPQTDVFIDLADARERDGGDVRFGVTDVTVDDLAARPVVRFTDSDGRAHELARRLPRRRRRVPQPVPPRRCPRWSDGSTSASTLSPGSGSLPRRPRAPRS